MALARCRTDNGDSKIVNESRNDPINDMKER